MDPAIRVGLALGGGVARGIAHVGVLQALAEHEIPVHAVAGTSAGSLVGAMYAAGLDPWLMERAAEQMNWRGLVRFRLRRDGLLDAEGLERFILGNVGDLQFSDLKIPFAALACDLVTGAEVVLREGRLATAVRASCAFPGIFLPVRSEGRVLVDGGLVNNVPASTVRALGADFVIAVELNLLRARKATPPRNLLHIILYSLAVLQRPQVQNCLDCADVTIHPEVDRFSILELERVRELIAAGRAAAYREIPAIKEGLERLAEQRRRPPGRSPGQHVPEPPLHASVGAEGVAD